MKTRLIKYMASSSVNIKCNTMLLFVNSKILYRKEKQNKTGWVCGWGDTGYLEGRWCSGLVVADSESMVSKYKRWSQGPRFCVHCMTLAQEISSCGTGCPFTQSFTLSTYWNDWNWKMTRPLVRGRSSPTPEPQPAWAPGIRVLTLTGGVRKQNLILRGLPWCPVSPFTVGVIHAISLIFLCGKDTKRQDTGEMSWDFQYL